jgi:hypothetical protein
VRSRYLIFVERSPVDALCQARGFVWQPDQVRDAAMIQLFDDLADRVRNPMLAYLGTLEDRGNWGEASPSEADLLAERRLLGAVTLASINIIDECIDDMQTIGSADVDPGSDLDPEIAAGTFVWDNFSAELNEDRRRLPSAFPTPEHDNYGFLLTGVSSHYEFSLIATDRLPDLHLLDTGQFFPRGSGSRSPLRRHSRPGARRRRRGQHQRVPASRQHHRRGAGEMPADLPGPVGHQG